MTRKHFVQFAAALAVRRPLGYAMSGKNSTDRQWESDVRAVADVLAASNGAFDRGRFELAAGIEEEVAA